MPIEVGGPYEVGGLRFEKTEDRWPYRVLHQHDHRWGKAPTLGGKWTDNAPNTILTDGGAPVAELATKTGTLLVGYAWDGSSGPAIDTRACMRASALHDVWCQAMRKNLYKNSYRNWLRGASEYRRLCRADGMPAWRASLRYSLVCTYGLNKLWPW